MYAIALHRLAEPRLTRSSIGGRSAAVTTASTPGSASARLRVDGPDARVGVRAAQDEARPRLPGERARRRRRARGRVTFSAASTRGGRLPTTLKPGAAPTAARGGRRLAPQDARRRAHRAHDRLVAGAAAEVAREPAADLVVRRVGVAVEQRLRRHEHAGRAEAALQRVLLDERALQRVQRRPSASPSTVRTSRPSTSAASTRQEFTSRPSSSTLQAPQLPSLQPSLAPVRPRASRKRLEQARAAARRGTRPARR